MSDHEPTQIAKQERVPLQLQLATAERIMNAEERQGQMTAGPRLILDLSQGVEVTPLADALVVGRGEEASVRLEDSDLSREHCRLVRRGEDSFLYDLDSTNGTWVNATRIEQRALVAGDLIYIGQQVFLYME